MRSSAFFTDDVEDTACDVQLDAEEYGVEDSEAYNNYILAVIERLKSDLK